MAEVISSRFKNVEKPRASASRAMTIRLTPISGAASYNAGANVQFNLPTQMRSNSFIDCNSSYLKYAVEHDANGLCSLDITGGGGLYSRVQLLSQGSMITDINSYPAYRKLKTLEKVPHGFLENDGKVMLGMGSSLADNGRGESLVANTKRYMCDFLANLSPMFATNTYLPGFTGDNLRLVLQMENARNLGAFAPGTTAVEDSNVRFSNFELVLRVVETTAELTTKIIKLHDGMFKFMLDDVRHFSSSIPAGVSSFNTTIGCSFSSMTGIQFVMTEPSSQTYLTYNNTWGKNDLLSYALLIDGQSFPLRRCMVDVDGAEAMCENRIMNHALSNYDYYGNVNKTVFNANGPVNGSATVTPVAGFVGSTDLTVYSGKNSEIRSGLNVLASNCQLDLAFGTSGAAHTLHIFTYFDSLVTLDFTEDSSHIYEISI